MPGKAVLVADRPRLTHMLRPAHRDVRPSAPRIVAARGRRGSGLRSYKSRLGVLCVVTLACAPPGCAIDQAKEVAAYRRVLDADAPGEARPLAPEEPLTLQRALVLANADNERLALSGEDYLQALIDKQRAFAEFLPTLSLAPRYTVSDDLGGPRRVERNRGFDVPLTADYTLFRGGGNVANLRRAAYTAEQRRALLLNVKADLLLEVARAFYAVLRAEREVRVLENSLAVQEERVRDVRAQGEAGTVRPLDLAQAEAQAASTRVAVVTARGEVRNTRAVLAFLVAAPAIDNPLLDEFEVPEASPLPAVHARAQERREDLRAAHALVLAGRRNVDAAVAQYYPSVALNLDYFVYKETVPDANILTALLQINAPLFSAGRITADVRDAWSVFRQAKQSESFITRQVREEVELAYQDLLTSRARLVELVTAVRAAQDAFDQAADLVRFGRATNLERLIAQDALLNAQLALATEEYTQKVAYLNLLRVAGDLDLRVLTAAPPVPAP